MIILSSPLFTNKAIDIDIFRKIRDFQDGINFFEFFINTDLYLSDHNPSFRVQLVILNLKIFEIEIYDIRHTDMSNGEADTEVLEVCND